MGVRSYGNASESLSAHPVPLVSARDAESRFLSVLHLAGAVYWEQGPTHRFSQFLAEPGIETRYLSRQLTGRNLDEVLAAGTMHQDVREAYSAALAAREPFHDIVCEFSGDGAASSIFFSFSGEPFPDSSGTFLGYRGIVRDVSARVRNERLSQQERALKAVLRNTDLLIDGLRSALHIVCEIQGWPAGRVWAIDEHNGSLREFASWHSGDVLSTPVLRRLAQAPTWVGQEPEWIGDLSAHELECLGTGALVPIHSRNHLVAILDFSAPGDAGPTAELLPLLRMAAKHIGRFFRRGMDHERLRESEKRFASTMELAAIGIAHVDHSGRLLYVNPQLCKMLGYTEKELTGLSVRDISYPGDVNATDDLRDKLRSGAIDSFKMEKRYVRKDGSLVWVSLTIAMKRDRMGHHVADISVVEDISARKSAEERVHYLATHDGLTGLPNRTMFAELLAHAIETAKRYSRQCAVLFIDLDRFKTVNDSLGHEAGDVLLRETAYRLRECVRAGDVVARLGGDEFVVLLQDAGGRAQVSATARDILSAAMRPVTILGQECRVSASIGVCMHPAAGQDDQAVMKHADIAMYQAKEEGRNNVQFYSPAVHTGAVGRLELESKLRRALERNEFTLQYQAKVTFRTGVITGVEALLRWHSPELGAVEPQQFIPVAEEAGLIVPIGRWALCAACAQNAQWLRQGLPPVVVSVNLSMRQLDDKALVDDIAAALRDSGLPPELLELEITESMIMRNVDRAIKLLSDIKALGVRLAIDDFGTGYSSLAHLKRFPIDTLKVDRLFISETQRDSEDRAIAEAIIAMGKTLSLTIVAEGVETSEQQALLSAHACDEMQGFFFSTPVAPEDFAALLLQHSPKPRS